MTTGSRGNPRSPGRTPPFILVGLLLILGFLAYSYWSLSSSHSDLVAELDSLQIEKKDIDQKNSEVEKNLENAREELGANQGSLDQARKLLQDKEGEIAILKIDLNAKQVDSEKFQTQLSQCDTSLAEHRSSLDTLKYEKGELNRLLVEAKQKEPSCNIESCNIPIKSVLAVAAKLLNSDTLGKALTEANFDAFQLLEGIQFAEPVAQQPKDNQQQQIQQNQQPLAQQYQQPQGQQPHVQVQQQPQQGQNQQEQIPNPHQQGQNQEEAVNPNRVVNPNPENNETQVKDNMDIDNSKTGKDASLAEESVAQPKGINDDTARLAEQEEKNKNVADIADMLMKEENERQKRDERADDSLKALKSGETKKTDKKKADAEEENPNEGDEIDEAEENLEANERR